MPKRDIEKNISNKFEESEEEDIKKEDVFEDTIEEKTPTKAEKKLPLADIELKIRRIDYNGLYVVDKKGSGINIPIPKRYSKEKLRVGDTIYVSQSEL